MLDRTQQGLRRVPAPLQLARDRNSQELCLFFVGFKCAFDGCNSTGRKSCHHGLIGNALTPHPPSPTQKYMHADMDKPDKRWHIPRIGASRIATRKAVPTMKMHGIYISQPRNGLIYIAERSRKGLQKLLWSAMPMALNMADSPINANLVPYAIRRQAYRHLAKPSD